MQGHRASESVFRIVLAFTFSEYIPTECMGEALGVQLSLAIFFFKLERPKAGSCEVHLAARLFASFWSPKETVETTHFVLFQEHKFS